MAAMRSTSTRSTNGPAIVGRTAFVRESRVSHLRESRLSHLGNRNSTSKWAFGCLMVSCDGELKSG